jgi:hypothetical protein
MYEKLSEFLKPFNDFISHNPEYGYLLCAGVFGLLLLGCILDWDWVVMPDSGSRRWFRRFLLENYGRKAARIWFGIILGLGTIVCLIAFYMMSKKRAKNSTTTQTEVSVTNKQ